MEREEVQEKIIELLTDKPQYQKDIVQKLRQDGIRIEERQLRGIFQQINKAYINGDYNFVVVSNSNGSYKSNDPQDIYRFNRNKVKHAKSELWCAYNVNKRLSQRNQLTIEEFLAECIQGGDTND